MEKMDIVLRECGRALTAANGCPGDMISPPLSKIKLLQEMKSGAKVRIAAASNAQRRPPDLNLPSQ